MTDKATQLLDLMGFADFGADPGRKAHRRFLCQKGAVDLVIYLHADADDWAVTDAIYDAGRQSLARDLNRKESEMRDLYRHAKPLPEDVPPRPDSTL